MKKILKWTLLGILAVIVVSVAAVMILLSSGEKSTEKPIVTDAAGFTYRVIVEPDTTYAVVTDEDDNRWAAQFDGDTVGSTVKNVNEEIAIEDVPTQYYGDIIDVTANADDYTGQVQQEQTTAPNEPEVTEPAKPEVYRIQKYQELFAGGTYLLSVLMNENGAGEAMTMAVKNGNIYASMEMDDMEIQIIYMAHNDTMYMLLDFLKKYCEVPQEMLGEDMDMSTLTSDFEIENIEDITVSKATLNGNVVTCESYVANDGSDVYYYFDENDTLVRRDWYSPDGNVDTMIFSQITNNVDDALFEIPSDYSYLNISWLLALVGE